MNNESNKKRMLSGDGIAFFLVILLACGVAVALSIFENYQAMIEKAERIYIANGSAEIDYANDCDALYFNNRLLLYANEGVPEEKIKSLADKYNVVLGDTMADIGVYQLFFPESYSIQELKSLIQLLQTEDGVLTAEIEWIIEVSTDTP